MYKVYSLTKLPVNLTNSEIYDLERLASRNAFLNEKVINIRNSLQPNFASLTTFRRSILNVDFCKFLTARDMP